MNGNQLKTGAILTYLSIGIGYIISIIYTPIMLRLLGQSEYGLYNLVSSVVSYLGLLSFGFGSAYMRYYSRYKVNDDKENIAKLNGMFLIIFSIIGCIALLAGIGLALNVNIIFGDKLTISELNTAKILMIILAFNMAFTFPASVFNTYVLANERFIFQKLLYIIKIIINPFIVLPVLLMGYGSIGMVISTCILTVINEIVTIYYCHKILKMKFQFINFNFSLMKEMAIFSSFIFLNMIIDQINWNLDKFILGRFQGTVSVAVYGLAAQINSYYLSLSTAISNVFIPRVNRMVAVSNDNSELTFLFIRVGRVQFMILAMILLGFTIFGQAFINIWAGVGYKETYAIDIVLMYSVTIPLIQNIGIEIQKAKNMHQFRSIVYFIIALGNLLISIPLAKKYGGIGAAIGTAISQVVGNVFIMNYYYYYKVGLNIKKFWREIFSFVPALISPIILGFLIYYIFDLSNIIVFLVSGVIYIFIYITSMWLFGMNDFEKNLIKGPLMKIINKLKI